MRMFLAILAVGLIGSSAYANNPNNWRSMTSTIVNLNRDDAGTTPRAEWLIVREAVLPDGGCTYHFTVASNGGTSSRRESTVRGTLSPGEMSLERVDGLPTFLALSCGAKGLTVVFPDPEDGGNFITVREGGQTRR